MCCSIATSEICSCLCQLSLYLVFSWDFGQLNSKGMSLKTVFLLLEIRFLHWEKITGKIWKVPTAFSCASKGEDPSSCKVSTQQLTCRLRSSLMHFVPCGKIFPPDRQRFCNTYILFESRVQRLAAVGFTVT